jgi:putative two-component system response regulator
MTPRGQSTAETGAKILVVDDEAPNRQLIEAMLEPLGYTVYLAASGQEAIEKAPQVHPDLVLLDIMMPGMNGFEVARILKANSGPPYLPIVMVTALTRVDDRVKALEAGADDFLIKPVDKTELRTRVQSLLKVKAYHDHMQDYQKKLEEDVAKKTGQLRHAFRQAKTASLETIHRLSRAAEYKDENTGAHVQRMSRYAAVIACRLGLSHNAVENILYAAPMHDVGKIGIPDYILLKPGKLDPDEWQLMQEHTLIGGEILGGSRSGFVQLGELIALTHHESWDGGGYPHGMAGNEIPMAGRITAIADVFDALTSKRPYKEAVPVDESMDIIRQGRGTLFDPQVVDVFFDAFREILDIREAHQDEAASILLRLGQK